MEEKDRASQRLQQGNGCCCRTMRTKLPFDPAPIIIDPQFVNLLAAVEPAFIKRHTSICQIYPRIMMILCLLFLLVWIYLVLISTKCFSLSSTLGFIADHLAIVLPTQRHWYKKSQTKLVCKGFISQNMTDSIITSGPHSNLGTPQKLNAKKTISFLGIERPL